MPFSESGDGPDRSPATAALRVYWRRTLALTAGLLAVWFASTFVVVWFAEPLSQFRFLGWPLSFYAVAQGALIVYVLVIWVYYRRMRVFDLDGGVAEPEE